MHKENPPIKLVFKYDGKLYPCILRDDITFVYWDEEYVKGWQWFWWLDGNGGCDCVRRDTIRRFHDFPVKGRGLFNECGHGIELVEYDVIRQCDDCFQWYPEDEIKECPCHLSFDEKIVTKEGIKDQKSRSNYCKNCALKHEKCCEGGWA